MRNLKFTPLTHFCRNFYNFSVTPAVQFNVVPLNKNIKTQLNSVVVAEVKEITKPIINHETLNDKIIDKKSSQIKEERSNKYNHNLSKK